MPSTTSTEPSCTLSASSLAQTLGVRVAPFPGVAPPATGDPASIVLLSPWTSRPHDLVELADTCPACSATVTERAASAFSVDRSHDVPGRQ